MKANNRVQGVRHCMLAVALAPAILLAAAPASAELVAGGPSANAPAQAVRVQADVREREFAEIRAAANQGSGSAQRRLGELYDKGSAGVPRDFAESMRWYQRAREQGEEIPTPHTYRATPWR